MTLVISGLLRLAFGWFMIDAQYQIETMFYKYLFVFSGLIVMVYGLKSFLTIYRVLRYTR